MKNTFHELYCVVCTVKNELFNPENKKPRTD